MEQKVLKIIISLKKKTKKKAEISVVLKNEVKRNMEMHMYKILNSIVISVLRTTVSAVGKMSVSIENENNFFNGRREYSYPISVKYLH